MGFKNEFYILLSGQEPYEIVLNSNFEDDFYEVFSGNIFYSKPVETNIKLGKYLYDVLSFDDGVNMAISERLYLLLKENHITGWKTYPLSIENVKDKYYGFQITGRSGGLLEPKEQGFYKGYDFNIDTWDSSDFFSPKDTHLRFITQRLKALLKGNDITNIDINNIKDVEAYSFGESDTEI